MLDVERGGIKGGLYQKTFTLNGRGKIFNLIFTSEVIFCLIVVDDHAQDLWFFIRLCLVLCLCT